MNNDDIENKKTSFPLPESCRPQLEAIQYLDKLKWHRESYLEGCKNGASSRDPELDEAMRTIGFMSTQIESLRCCGNCGNEGDCYKCKKHSTEKFRGDIDNWKSKL